ncbi:protein DpdD [Microbacterium sp. B35-30]|uniref:protein DpdD n=1 Tax=Microbacterium sp. B35-30 TaxID=1962642 RepID=UPI0013D727BD|nr:protein DpdD [Microbacterium sp. B35-30]
MSSIGNDEFTARFFSDPNTTWPGQDPDAAVATALKPFLAALTKRGECPLVLPRREASWHAASYYVICWDTAHAGRVRALLDAATAANWTPFDGRVARLNRQDPIDAAVLELVGDGTTFVLRPDPATASPTYRALGRLVRSLHEIPLRNPTPPRPIGRMLREFDLALAAGAVETSGRLLQEIEMLGGISHENVAFLQIRRMARLGRDTELLAHGSLPSVVYAEPPRLVREGVLGAWARVNLDPPVADEQIDDAVERIRGANPDVAMLVEPRLAASVDRDAVTAGGLVALARGDVDLITEFASNDFVDDAVQRRLQEILGTKPAASAEQESRSDQMAPPQAEDAQISRPPQETEAIAGLAAEELAEHDAAAVEVDDELGREGESAHEVEVAPDVEVHAAPAINSWIDWARAIGPGVPVAISQDQAASWPPVATIDGVFADAIDDVDMMATDDLLLSIAFFLEADDFERPAPRSAEAFLRRYLLTERFAPADLAVICALLDVFLRGAPSAARYREVLGDVRASSERWVAIATASRALDIADTVALGPTVDASARADFVTTLLSPLNQQKRRLDGTLRDLAALVTADVGLDFDWSVPLLPESTEGGPDLSVALRILLYSLDEGTLARVEKAIGQRWPAATVRTSSEKDGSPMLKQHARNSDLIVVATRRAAHAATGCIGDNAGSALVRYPDGAGSASMLRAVVTGISELTD